jgi:hypothetical protein
VPPTECSQHRGMALGSERKISPLKYLGASWRKGLDRMNASQRVCQLENFFPKLYDIFRTCWRIFLLKYPSQRSFVRVFKQKIEYVPTNKASVVLDEVIVIMSNFIESGSSVFVILLSIDSRILFEYEGIGILS